MWMEVQLAKRICSENTFLYLLHCFSEFGEIEQNKAHGMVTNYTLVIYVNSNETKKWAITMPKQGLEFQTLNFKALFFFFSLSPLCKIPVNFWDIRVVSKQA